MISSVSHHPELEKYQVLEEIGHGGMATVYRARDRRLERDVAVKVIHRHLRENGEVAARFTSEARAVAKLKHPNIVEVYDVSDDNDPERYLIVELVEGTTLRKLLQERGALPAEVAAAVGLEIGSALQHAHEQGVIHRDVKPENVLVSSRTPVSTRQSAERQSEANRPRIKITDFGIAKLLDAQGVTSTGQVLGSPAHMAPEQIEGGDVTAQADVFGLGVLLYECMVGRLPFEGKNPAQVLRRVLDGVFTPPERARPTIGQRLSRVLERALARDVAARYQSVSELCDALAAELDSVGFADPRRELAEYLADPDAYDRGYAERVVPKLVLLGKEARVRGDVPGASAQFNRALALKPGDQDLVEQVAGMERRERLKRILIKGGAILAGSATLGLIAFAVTRATRVPVLVTAERLDEPLANRDTPIPTIHPPKRTDKPPPDVKTSAPAPAPVLVPGKPAPVEPEMQDVRVVIQGAKGILRINGEEKPWMGVTHKLPVGDHRFEVVPPEEKADCCVPKPAQTIRVEPQKGVRLISLSLPFRDATLSLVGEPGTEATCGTLFTGKLGAGRSINVRMPEAMLKGDCSVTGPDGVPGSKPVVLNAGKSSTLNWP